VKDSRAKVFYEKIWTDKLAGSFWSGRADIITPLMPKGRYALLDVGCGNGELGRAYASEFEEVHGIDVSEVAVGQARSSFGMVAQTVDLNVERIPYADSYFDVVTCLDVIEHVIDPLFVCQEIYRVLKNDGILIVSTQNVAFIKLRLRLLVGNFPGTSGDKDGIDGGHLHLTVRSFLTQYSRFDRRRHSICV